MEWILRKPMDLIRTPSLAGGVRDRVGSSTGRTHIVHVTEAFSAGVLDCVAIAARVASSEGAKVTVVFEPRAEQAGDWRGRFPQGTRFLPVPFSLRPPLVALRTSVTRLRDFLEHLSPSLIHLHSSWAGFVGRLAVRTQWPIAYSPQAFAFLRQDCSWFARVAFTLGEILASRAGGVVFAASESEARYARRVTRHSHVALVENAVADHPAFHKRTPIGQVGGRLVGCGRLVPQKDPAAFVRIATAVRDAIPELELVWIGDGPLRRAIEAFCSAARLPLRVTGWVSRDHVIAELKAASVLLHTARWEGMPLALLDAFGAGVPVVAKECPGVIDAIEDGSTGQLWRTEEQAVQQVLQMLKQPATADRFAGQAWRVQQERFSEQAYRRRLWQAYESLLRNARISATAR